MPRGGAISGIGRRGVTLGIAGVLAGCAPRRRSSRDPRQLVVMGFGGPFEKAFRAAVIQPFLQEHPGASIDYREIANSAQSLAALRLGRDSPDVDIAILDIAVSFIATREQLLAPLAARDVPYLAAVPGWGRPAGSHGVAFTRDNLSMLYNPARAPAPGDWSSLGDAVYRDDICLPIADTRGVVLLALLSHLAGVDYRRSIDPGLDFLKRLSPSVATWTAQPDIYTLVRSGNVSIGVGWNGRGQMLSGETPGVLGSVIPARGSVSQINTLALAKSAANPRLAHAFIDRALSPAAQHTMAEIAFYGPTNGDVELPPAVAAKVFGSLETTAPLQLDWAYVSTIYNPWIRRIEREVISG